MGDNLWIDKSNNAMIATTELANEISNEASAFISSLKIIAALTFASLHKKHLTFRNDCCLTLT